MNRARRFLVSPLLLSTVVFGCGAGATDDSTQQDEEALLEEAAAKPPPPDPGALVDVTVNSRVAVVLDEIPTAQRASAASFYLSKPTSFWIDRAKAQVAHTNYRLIYRDFFYHNKKMLSLPPQELWVIGLAAGGAKRVTTADGHDAVQVAFTLTTTILTDAASPGAAEPALGSINGVWNEPFSLPLDPEFLFQRTGWACMDEDGYPLNTGESENASQLFDDTCEVETEMTRACHISDLPTESCKDALANHVGRVDTNVTFKRVAYTLARANQVGIADYTHTDGPDLAVVQNGLATNRIVYRYVAPNSCAIVEQCVKGPGWRRLLEFDASIQNKSTKPLAVGNVKQNSPYIDHNVFVFSACHQHYHFSHYGDFSYGATAGDKRAFCIESTDRYFNSEETPLVHPFSCDDQGVASGWGDTYIAGTECNWIDVTNLSIPANGTTQQLRFELNPDNFICEGTPVTDAQGKLVFEPTEFIAENGEPVDRPACSFVSNYQSNNIGTRNVTIPKDGSMVTSACTRSQAGPLRDCGFTEQQENLACTPGATVNLACTVGPNKPTQALRVCENSTVLGGGIACMHHDALTSGVVASAGATHLHFTCPTPRDATEPGGKYALYVAPVLATDALKPITCTPE